MILVVDDMFLEATGKKQNGWFIKEISKFFDIRDIGEIKFGLGFKIEFVKEYKTVALSQRAYTDEVLKRFKMENCKGAKKSSAERDSIER